MNYIDIRELPKCVRDVLKKVIGWKRNEIPFELIERISLRRSSTLRYNRGFAILINLDTGAYRIGIGSYGGSNQSFNTIIDDCDFRFKFPANYVIIKGEHGTNGVYATLYMRPDNTLALIGSDEDHEDRKYKILKICQNITFPTKNVLLAGSKPIDLRDLIKSSMLVSYKDNKTKQESLRITKLGKKCIKRYEAMYPHKVYKRISR